MTFVTSRFNIASTCPLVFVWVLSACAQLYHQPEPSAPLLLDRSFGAPASRVATATRNVFIGHGFRVVTDSAPRHLGLEWKGEGLDDRLSCGRDDRGLARFPAGQIHLTISARIDSTSRGSILHLDHRVTTTDGTSCDLRGEYMEHLFSQIDQLSGGPPAP